MRLVLIARAESKVMGSGVSEKTSATNTMSKQALREGDIGFDVEAEGISIGMTPSGEVVAPGSEKQAQLDLPHFSLSPISSTR